MKHQVLSTVLALSILAFVAVSSASAGGVLTAKVPFAFTVGQKAAPAGDYKIDESNPGRITIRGDQFVQFLLTNQETRAGNDESAKLVFHRYGDQYFLAEVFDGTSQEGRRIPTSKLEKEYIKEGSNSTAASRRQTEIVVYAMVQ